MNTFSEHCMELLCVSVRNADTPECFVHLKQLLSITGWTLNKTEPTFSPLFLWAAGAAVVQGVLRVSCYTGGLRVTALCGHGSS